MIRSVFTITFLWLIALSAMSQKKELNQAEDFLKKGTNLEKAEKLMTDLLKQPEHLQNKKIYLMWYKLVTAQYEVANEKLYLNQKYDTAQFFGLLQRMYQVAETLDSIDAKPDKKGRVRPDYRKRHAEQLNALRYNLYYGGSYQMRRADYHRAYSFFQTYLDADQQPLFTGYDYLKKDTMMPQAAYWAMSCAYRLEQPDLLLRYADIALRDVSRQEYTLQYICEAHRWQHNDSAYVASLRKGFEVYPEHTYFFPRLADWYTAHMMPDSVLTLTNKALSINPDNQLFLLARSVAQLNTGDDAGCIETSEQLIALNDTLAEAYYNIATVRLNQALVLEAQNEPRKNRLQLISIYRQARPYMETYRQLAPDQKKRWAPALYRIYLNLNMGKQFEEIDQMLRKMK